MFTRCLGLVYNNRERYKGPETHVGFTGWVERFTVSFRVKIIPLTYYSTWTLVQQPAFASQTQSTVGFHAYQIPFNLHRGWIKYRQLTPGIITPHPTNKTRGSEAEWVSILLTLIDSGWARCGNGALNPTTEPPVGGFEGLPLQSTTYGYRWLSV